MQDAAHRDFTRWAAWLLAPDMGSGGAPSGYGKSVLARIMDGRGQIMPGGKGMVRVFVDPVGVQVDTWVKKLKREDARILKVFYLSRYWTVEKKAHRLGMPVRTLYWHIDRLHGAYLSQRCSDNQ